MDQIFFLITIRIGFVFLPLFLVPLEVQANKAGFFPRDNSGGSTAPYYDHVSYQQGLEKFQAHDYAGALTLFTKETEYDPTDAKAFYYEARCQAELGKWKQAALNFYRSNQLQDSATVRMAGDRAMAKLSPLDQAWVHSRLKGTK